MFDEIVHLVYKHILVKGLLRYMIFALFQEVHAYLVFLLRTRDIVCVFFSKQGYLSKSFLYICSNH